MFVCWFVCLSDCFFWSFYFTRIFLTTKLIFLFKSSEDTHRKMSWRFCKEIELNLADKMCLFVCLIIYSSWGTRRKIPSKFLKIRLNLAELLSIYKSICLYVCLFGCFCLSFIWIVFGYLHEDFLKVPNIEVRFDFTEI